MRRKGLRALISLAISVTALGATAAGASAAPAAFNIPANSSAAAVINGTVSVTDMFSTTSCTFTNAKATVKNSGSPSQGTLTVVAENGGKASCANGRGITVSLIAAASKSGTAFSITNSSTGLWGLSAFPEPFSWLSGGFTVAWTNGSGKTASSIAFPTLTQVSKAESGYANLWWTGTLKISKQDGSLLTLS